MKYENLYLRRHPRKLFHRGIRCVRDSGCGDNFGREFSAFYGRRARAGALRYRKVRQSTARSEKYGAENDVLSALKSCDTRKEQVCFAYVKQLTELKKSIKNAFNLPEVVDFNDILYKITGETHRLKGLLRFKETAGGVLYAPYSPDNDITDLLTPHFAARLRSEKFIIHDINRGIAGLYDGRGWIITHVGEAEICLSDSELAFEGLWKKYYKSVNIESRPHERQMKRSMPVRYWKFLPEKKRFKRRRNLYCKVELFNV